MASRWELTEDLGPETTFLEGMPAGRKFRRSSGEHPGKTSDLTAKLGISPRAGRRREDEKTRKRIRETRFPAVAMN